MDIYITRSGQTSPEGPYTSNEVSSRLKDGRLDASCQAWAEGMEDWMPIENVLKELGGTSLQSGTGKIFINHRARSQIMAKRSLYIRLKGEYGDDNLFFFENTVDIGENYPERIRDAIEESAVMLSIIGPHWAGDIGKSDGVDWVEREIIEAERLGVPIFPLLLDGENQYPSAEDLPEDLQFLANYVGCEISPVEEEFEIDFKKLVESINKQRKKKQTPTLKPQAQTCPEPRCPFPRGPVPSSAWSALGVQGTRTRGLYQPENEKPFRLSRSKLENFLRCPCCFYLDRRLGIGPPFGAAFTINIAVDALLKKEFDKYREAGEAHPLMIESVPGTVPWPGLARMNDWRNNFRGIQFLHAATNLELFGAVDDIWVNTQGELIVVDYKATSKAQAIQSTEDVGGWYGAYKRQLEIYVWLLRQQSEFIVSNDIYWVYANGDKTRDSFEGRLEFEMTIIKDQADDSWVEEALGRAHECLQSDALPAPSQDCDFCKYLGAISHLE